MKKSVYEMDRAMMKAWLKMLDLEAKRADPEVIAEAEREYKRLSAELMTRIEADEKELLIREGDARQAKLAFYED